MFSFRRNLKKRRRRTTKRRKIRRRKAVKKRNRYILKQKTMTKFVYIFV